MKLLSQYARDVIQRASKLNRWASDVYLASDDLIRPFKRLDEQKADLKKLQHDVVFDKSLKPKLIELEKIIAQNEETLALLEKECSTQGMTDRFSIFSLREKLRFISEQLEIEAGHFNDRTLQYREAASKLGNPDLANQHHAVIKAKSEYNSKCADLRKEYSRVSDNIEALENILRAFKY